MAYDLGSLHRDISKAASEQPQYLEEIRRLGGLTLAELEKLDEEQLIAVVKKSGAVITREKLTELAKIYKSAVLVIENIIEESELTLEEGWVKDSASLALMQLWELWLPLTPCLEMTDLKIFDGYVLNDGGNEAAALELWLKAAGEIFDFCADEKIDNLEVLIEMLEGEFEFAEWVDDMYGLLQAELEEGRILQLRAVANQFISVFPNNFNRVISISRLALAQSYYSLNEPQKGEAFYLQWLSKDAWWAHGWSGYADNYLFGAFQDPDKAEGILKKGLERVDTNRKAEIALRLKELFGRQGKFKEEIEMLELLKKLQEETKDQPDALDEYFPGGSMFNEELPIDSLDGDENELNDDDDESNEHYTSAKDAAE